MRFTLLLLLLLLLIHLSAAAAATSSSSHLVRTSCQRATYPDLCLQTLSTFLIRTPLALAHAAVAVSLSRARALSLFLSRLSSSSSATPRQRVATRDCVEQDSDSVDELTRALNQLRRLRAATFRWQMSNAQTWVRAALTDDDTCLDGLTEVADGESTVRADVRRRIRIAARVTSNALYMINRLDGSHGRPRSEP